MSLEFQFFILHLKNKKRTGARCESHIQGQKSEGLEYIASGGKSRAKLLQTRDLRIPRAGRADGGPPPTAHSFPGTACCLALRVPERPDTHSSRTLAAPVCSEESRASARLCRNAGTARWPCGHGGKASQDHGTTETERLS